jgi:thiol-disulfide isomerase/thioredoxin
MASPLAGCDGLDSPPPRAGPAVTGEGEDLPELELSCFTGGEPFNLGALRGPAVVNLWASWCPPCREELPALQRYADAHTGQVHVLGVITADSRDAATALAADLGISLPGLTDPDATLRARLGGVLPVTLFVDAAGQVRHVHPGALDEAEVAALVTEHLVGQP